MSDPARIGVALAGAVVLMVAIWLVQRARRNAGIVDVAWSFATGVAGAFLALGASGAAGRRYLVAGMALAWALRLGVHLLRRVASEEEDGRYHALRRKWGDRTQAFLFVFFLAQAVVALLFALPMLAAASNAAPFPAWYDLAALAVFAGALAGETIADRQLARFRRDPANRGRVCREGLWRFSRHPNYFFEWLHWFAYVLPALAAPLGWLSLLAPAAMLFLLLRVTGVPPTEARAMESRGEEYRRYRREVSVFLPLPPRESSS